MEITEVKVFPVNEEKLKAFVSIVFDRCFMVNDIKIIQGRDGLFISMPSRKKKSGEFKDIAHPLNNDTRRRIELEVVGEYERVLAERGEELPAPARAHNLGTDSDDDGAGASAEASDGAEEAAGGKDEAMPSPAARPPATTPPPPAEAPRAVAAATSGNGSEDGATAPAAAEKTAPAEAEDEPEEASEEHEDKLEEVQERHLRDSFWSVS